MSHKNNTAILEKAKEDFEIALSHHNFNIAQQVVTSLADQGFKEEAKFLGEKLSQVNDDVTFVPHIDPEPKELEKTWQDGPTVGSGRDLQARHFGVSEDRLEQMEQNEFDGNARVF